MTILSLLFLSFEPIITVLAIICLTRWRKLICDYMKKRYRMNQCVNVCSFKVQGYVTHVKGWTFKVYSISTRLQLNNHRSLFNYLNIFCFFRNMTSFGNIRRYLATTVSKPCFALYVINLVVRIKKITLK